MMEWWQAHSGWIGWLTAASLVMFFGTLLVIPPLVARIPPDYFVRRRRERMLKSGRHPAIGYALLIGKNLIGAFFVLAGLAMLVLPGQGVVTILIGLLFLDFPGKFRLESKIVRQAPVMRALNWMRERAGRPPLIVPAKKHRRPPNNLASP